MMNLALDISRAFDTAASHILLKDIFDLNVPTEVGRWIGNSGEEKTTPSSKTKIPIFSQGKVLSPLQQLPQQDSPTTM